MAIDRGPLVVKLGTSTLTGEDGKVDRAFIASLASQLNNAREQGYRPLVVTSASIACGLETLGIVGRPSDTPSLQAAASVGQISLARIYSEVFAEYGMVTSSVLLTRRDTASRSAYLHARDTLNKLMEWSVVPIINENDTVSVEQIRFGDNDTLSALVACLIQASRVIIFSDIDGLYDANPATHADAKRISHVTRIGADIMAAAEGPGSKQASGGMITKIRAARVLMAAGIPLTICNGREPQVLSRLLADEPIGTEFSASAAPHEITPRKLWIALGDSSRGTLTVDDGARDALISGGSSLLPVGLVKVEGDFEVGDIVDIVDGTGYLFARGRAEANADEAQLSCGRSQAELSGNRLFTRLAQHPLIHRDELIVFE